MIEHKDKVLKLKNEVRHHLTEELLPFWSDRCKDDENGGFITHFDKEGNDTGVDEKSMLGQARCIYSFASAHRAGYGDGKYLEYAKHGIDFVIEKMWDEEHEGFFWLTDRKGNVLIDEKIIYGHSFIIYGFCEYTLASEDPRGLY